MRSATPSADAHHHALGTLARDTHDTVSFHTALNTTHTTHPPHTAHPPGPHPHYPPPRGTTPATGSPRAVTAPGRVDGGRVHATAPRCRRGVAGDGVVPRDWWYVPTWAPRGSAGSSAAAGQWLVFADADLGAELGRELDCRATGLPAGDPRW